MEKFDLDRSISDWKKRLWKQQGLEPGYIEELECNLRDRIDDYISDGHSEKEAFELAKQKSLDSPEALADEYFKVTSKKRTPPWKGGFLLKKIFRRFRKELAITIIKTAGLSLTLLASALMFLFVYHETSYDAFHKHAENIYRVEFSELTGDVESNWAATPGFIIPRLKHAYAEIELAVKTIPSPTLVFKYLDEQHVENRVMYVDSLFFEIFNFKFVRSNKGNAFTLPNGIVITNSTAVKYFGDEDPIGKILVTNENNQYVVSGVIEDVPIQSHFHFDIIIPLSDLRSRWDEVDKISSAICYSYIRLQEGTDIDDFARKVNMNIKSYFVEYAAEDPNRTSSIWLRFQPIVDIHLQGHAEKEFEANGSITIVYILSSLGIFVLFVGILNYINLSTAQNFQRDKETGILKILGAERNNIIFHFVVESLILTTAAVFIACILIVVSLPFFNELAGIKLALHSFVDMDLALAICCVLAVVGLLSGFYPGLILSRVEPIQIVKGIFSKGRGSESWLRRAFIVFQFLFSTAVIIASFTVYKQLQFIQNRELGFNKEEVVVLPFVIDAKAYDMESLKKEILSQPNVISASLSSVIPGERIPVMPVFFPGMPRPIKSGEIDYTTMRVMSGDEDLLTTFQFEMSQGRFLSKDYPSDAVAGFVLNEAAIKDFGIEKPLGHRFDFFDGPERKVGTIVGVVKNFNYASLHNKIEPLMIHVWSKGNNYLSLRVKSNDIQETLKNIEKVWRHRHSGLSFDYFFLDNYYDKLYSKEQKTGQILAYLTGVSIFIACLGLIGLISFTVEQKLKEIGIRRVLGATNSNVFTFVAKEILISPSIGSLLAWVPAYFLLRKWLETFVYKIELNPFMFLLGTFTITVCAFVLISLRVLAIFKVGLTKLIKYE